MGEVFDSGSHSPDLVEKATDAYDDLDWLAGSAYAYLSIDAERIIKKHLLEWDKIKAVFDRERNSTEDRLGFITRLETMYNNSSKKCLKELTKQARYDLRPNLGKFWSEFWTCFFHG